MLAQIGKGAPPAYRRLALRSEMGRRPRPVLHRSTASCAWFRATATPSTASIPSFPSFRITSKPTRRFWMAKSRRSTNAACPASNCCNAASTSPKRSAIATLARKDPVVFFAFDLLYLDGHDLRGTPLDRTQAAARRNPHSRATAFVTRIISSARRGAARSRQAAGPGRHRRQTRQQFLRIAAERRLGEVESDRIRLLHPVRIHPGERDCFGALVLGILRRRQTDVGRQRRHRIRSQDDEADSFETCTARDIETSA